MAAGRRNLQERLRLEPSKRPLFVNKPNNYSNLLVLILSLVERTQTSPTLTPNGRMCFGGRTHGHHTKYDTDSRASPPTGARP